VVDVLTPDVLPGAVNDTVSLVPSASSCWVSLKCGEGTTTSAASTSAAMAPDIAMRAGRRPTSTRRNRTGRSRKRYDAIVMATVMASRTASSGAVGHRRRSCDTMRNTGQWNR